MWALKLMFAGILQEALTFGVGTLAILACLAGAYLLPTQGLKKIALAAAAAIGVFLLAYGIGVQNEYDRQRAKEIVLKRQADDARKRAEEAIPTVDGDPDAPVVERPDVAPVPGPDGKPAPKQRAPKRVRNDKPLDKYDRSGWQQVRPFQAP